jgi:hypothetical protein
MPSRRLAPLLLLASACLDEDPYPSALTDQSGAVFAWECSEDRCSVTRREDSPTLAAERAVLGAPVIASDHAPPRGLLAARSRLRHR